MPPLLAPLAPAGSTLQTYAVTANTDLYSFRVARDPPGKPDVATKYKLSQELDVLANDHGPGDCWLHSVKPDAGFAIYGQLEFTEDKKRVLYTSTGDMPFMPLVDRFKYIMQCGNDALGLYAAEALVQVAVGEWPLDNLPGSQPRPELSELSRLHSTAALQLMSLPAAVLPPA